MREAQGQDAPGAHPLKTCDLVTSSKLWPVFIVVMFFSLSFSACEETISQLSFPEINVEQTPYLSLFHCLPRPPFWEQSPKRDNQIISPLVRTHQPPSLPSVQSNRALGHKPPCELVPPLCGSKELPTTWQPNPSHLQGQGLQWDLGLPGPRAGL